MNTIRDEAADQARWSDLNYIINSSGVTFDNFLFASVPGFYKNVIFNLHGPSSRIEFKDNSNVKISKAKISWCAVFNNDALCNVVIFLANLARSLDLALTTPVIL